MRAPFGSSLNDPNVQAALEGFAQAAQTAAQMREAEAASQVSLPAVHGSSLNDPNVQAALEGFAQAAQTAAQMPDANAELPAVHGSNLNDPNVQAALQGLAQLQAGGAPTIHLVKNALNGGELSPEMLARFDLPRYQSGCESLLNMVPLAAGGVSKRPGFRFVSGTGGAWDETRLIPFSYSSDIRLMLMLLANSGGAQLYILDRDGRDAARAACVLPYRRGQLSALSYAQVGKRLYLAHPQHKPACVEYDGTTFSYRQIDFTNRVPVPEIESLEIVGIPNENWGWRHYKVTAIDEETGEESMPSEVMSLQTSTLTTSFMCKITITPVAGCSEYRVYKLRGGEYGFIGRTSRHTEDDAGNEQDTYEFLDQGYDPDISDPPPREQTFFDGAGNYPSLVFLHQQRLGWAATDNDPLTIWMSQTSNFECLASKLPPQDDDAIEATLASTQANRILWAVSDRSGLALGTAGEEWYLTGASGEGAALTPASISFQPQTRYGTQEGVPPIRANGSLLFAQKGGRIARDLGYSYQSDRYEARDLTLLARHLFSMNTIADWCWQGSPYCILWCVLSNGKMAAFTYMPDNEVAAWHRHETAGTIMSCATLEDSEGRPRLWVVTSRIEGMHVEMMDNFVEPGVDWDNPTITPKYVQHLDGQARHTFRARIIPCLPEAGMENASSAMRVRKINAVKCRVLNSWPFTCRVFDQDGGQSEEMPVPIRANATSAESFIKQADWQCPIGAGFREGARLELICDGPRPLTILGLSVALEVSTENASQTGGA